MAGAVARDGCPVELYRRLPYFGELRAFASELPAGACLLELGCGVGRVTRPLIDAGFRVTAVDNSPDMLAFAPREATLVLADIERLRLDERFDAVLMASCLVNAPDEAIGRAYLETCRHHLENDGLLIFERHDPKWLLEAQLGFISTAGPIAMHLESAARTVDIADLCVRYEHRDGVWRHRFRARALDDAAIALRCAGAGLAFVRWLDARRTYGLARVPR